MLGTTEICHGRVVGDCIRGDRSADHEILLLGDSHGAQLNLFADVVGQSFHTKIRVVTASSCLPIEGFDVERPVEWARAPCFDQIEKAKSYIPLAQGLILAGMWQYHFKSERFLQALDRFIDEAAKRNQRVIVLAQLPMLESNVLRQFRFEHLGLPHSRVETHPEWRAANQRIRELVARHPLATFLDTAEDPLFANAPFENGVLLYYDSHHLNEVGSRRYGEVASAKLSSWFASVFSDSQRP